MSDPRPFSIHVPERQLEDLRDRLRRSRLLPDSPRRMRSGMNAAYLRELVDSWIEFDWRAREAYLNAHPQFLADVDGTTLHFVHQQADAVDAPTLLVMHGWPHTFALQLELLDRLPDWNVVAPSLPGFAFSPAYPDGPITEDRLARTMHLLMTQTLGYERYITYGEDVSANVNDLIAGTYPDVIDGIVATHAHFGTPIWWIVVVLAMAAVVLVLSWWPLKNLFSRHQLMNASFNRLHLVNAYGAFGSVTKERYEIIVEGTTAQDPTEADWMPYEFKGKPGDPRRVPGQFAPYHLRLDWLMWFLALGSPGDRWFPVLALRLLEADRPTLKLLARDPFDGQRPVWVRARVFLYRFATRAERKATGLWWIRMEAGSYLRPVRLEHDGRVRP